MVLLMTMRANSTSLMSHSGEPASWRVNPPFGPLPGSVLGFGDAGGAATEATEAAPERCLLPSDAAGLTKGSLVGRSVSGMRKRD